MKFYLLIFLFFLNYSKSQTINNVTSTTTIIHQQSNTTTSWWTRTYPVTITRTMKPHSKSQLKSTTIPIRISRTIRLTIPIVILLVTILFGFGLITFAIITHGNGVSFLTRTDQGRAV